MSSSRIYLFLVLMLLIGACSRREAMTPSAAAKETGAPPAVPCTAFPCLKNHEGAVVEIEGVYLSPPTVAFAVPRLRLSDSMTVVFSPYVPEFDSICIPANDMRVLRVRGRIYTGMVPDRYNIIGRTAEPHLVDVEWIRLH